MSLSFYDTSVASYLQVLRSVAGILQKGQEAADNGELNLEELVQYRMQDDMLPFSFQIISVWHQSLGALNAMESGEFAPPPSLGDLDYSQLVALINDAIQTLEGKSVEDVNKLAEGTLIFKVSGREIPFTVENFLTSFSLPNFYFHATTTYAILRMHGVALGKMDFLGQLKVGV